MKILLDTHILVFWLENETRLSVGQRHAFAQAGPDNPILLSDISLWEIATLYNLGRISLDRPIREWLTKASAPPLVRCAHITPAVAATVAELPNDFPRDPADRIIVSTAILHGAVLLTNDERIKRSDLVETL